MTAPVVRPMREEDLEAFGEITATSYYEVDARTYQRAWPDPVRRPPGRNAHWMRRTARALVTDPGGCWVAEVDGEVVGGAVSFTLGSSWTGFAILMPIALPLAYVFQARGFAGAWPYLELIARETGVAQPLDQRVVEAYWLGSSLLQRVEMSSFGRALFDRFRSRAGALQRSVSAEACGRGSPRRRSAAWGSW